MKPKEILKTFVQVITTLLCILSLLAIYNFCTAAYALPSDRMCRIYASSLWWVTLLFSALLILTIAIDDAVWEHIGDGGSKEAEQIEKSDITIWKTIKTLLFTADEEYPIEEEENIEADLTGKKTLRKAKLKCAIWLYPLYVVLTELAMYAASELGHETLSLETCLFISGIAALDLSIAMFFRRSILCGDLNRLLTMHQKLWIRCIIVAVCVISALLFVPRAASRITTYNMYWEGAPQMPYTFTYSVNEKCGLTVENIDGFREDLYTSDFDLLPRKVLSKFAADGWTIRIDSNELAERSWQSNGKRYGPLFYAMTDYTNKTVIAHSAYFAMQEIGRYCYSEMTDKDTVNRLFAAEAEKLCTDGTGQGSSAGASFENAEHFFAFCFAKYAAAQDNETAGEHLAQKIPLTYNYLSTEIFNEDAA